VLVCILFLVRLLLPAVGIRLGAVLPLLV
jgi:hypothetical protein